MRFVRNPLFVMCFRMGIRVQNPTGLLDHRQQAVQKGRSAREPRWWYDQGHRNWLQVMMENRSMEYKRALHTMALVSAALLLAACSSVAPQPTETYDGLVLVPESRFSTVYRRPDVDLTHYDSFGLVRCEVAFKKNWMRDQNNTRMDLGSRVTQKDVDRIRERLSDACDKYFREALQQPPPYRLVESFSDGEQVLVLRPAIINLDIAAPDIRSAGVQRSYTTEAGQMTLVLEVLDGTTGQILLRVIDRQRAGESSYLQWTNSVTNQADAQRILGRWARQLREGLDEATGGARTSK